ncbi:YiiX/YebB-like N1pC/P60 family cysteine hydrolase [Microbulbifer hainanensis]|uniref:YiiX/YebB-like N1pC/P60 family cysteine hydrolase n=1 Tax=Microbulbifer hainanensis TaxID=2735675 RepID=UPI00186798B0|nr:YiiX/YebB-like N1pC/P60 family cysteine hydrolase [Microbulbifer hainanensis]
MPSYNSLRETLKTGDIVIFSGKSAISNIIKLFSGGKWSHVGMVLRLKEFDNAVLLWESTKLNNIPDIETLAATKGVQLVPLSQRVVTYEGEIKVRQLNKVIGQKMQNKLAECRKQLSRRPYERSEIELLKAAYDGIGGASSGEDLSSLFCSELVAEAYQAMGLLPEYPHGLPSNEYTPMDFSSRRSLKLAEGYELGLEITIS